MASQFLNELKRLFPKTKPVLHIELTETTTHAALNLLDRLSSEYPNTRLSLKVTRLVIEEDKPLPRNNTWDSRDLETGRHVRNLHILVLSGTYWECEGCGHDFDAAADADLFLCGDKCVHPFMVERSKSNT